MQKTNIILRPFIAGLIFSCLFILISSVNLTAQGLHYDEAIYCRQSFYYIGHGLPVDYDLAISGIPVLAWSYATALKAAIYGIFMNLMNAGFTVYSWRMTGILIVSLGILMFYAIAGRRMRLSDMIIFAFLLLTDTSLVLLTRHDFGYSTIGIALRLIFLATWYAGGGDSKPPTRNSFMLALWAGFAIFDKLTSIFLLLPLMFMMLVDSGRRNKRHIIAMLSGLASGLVPLAVINGIFLIKESRIISIADFGMLSKVQPFQSIAEPINNFIEYFKLGGGAYVRTMMLGERSIYYGEGSIVLLLILLSIIICILSWSGRAAAKMILIMELSYLAIGISMIPLYACNYQILIGTPFQYMGILLTYQTLRILPIRGSLGRKVAKFIFMTLLVLLIVFRMVSLGYLEKVFVDGRYSKQWSTSFTKLGAFAASRPEAVFITCSWGVGTQIYCLSNGRPRSMYEIHWEYKGAKDIEKAVKASGKKIVYIVGWDAIYLRKHSLIVTILEDADRVSGLINLPVEEELSSLKDIVVRKYSFKG